MDALQAARNNAERSYVAAKSTVSRATTDDLFAADAPGGVPVHRPDLSKAEEQLKHNIGWVFASIRPIAQRIAAQAIHVARELPLNLSGSKAAGDSSSEVPNHPIIALLKNPNDLMVGFSLLSSCVTSLELTGRALWWVPDKKRVFPIPISWLVGITSDERYTSFQVRPPKEAMPFDLPADECVYFSYPSASDPTGATSPLQSIAAAVDSDENLQVAQRQTFVNGVFPRHIIRICKDATTGNRPRLTGAQKNQLFKILQSVYTGAVQSGRPFILDGWIESIDPLAQAELDFLASSKLTKERITQGFGVNPIILGEVEGANRASSLAAEIHFTTYCLNPKISLISECLSEYLGPIFGGKLRIWLEDCVPKDAEMQIKKMDLAAKAGVITANELREFTGLPADDKFDGLIVGGRDMGTSGMIEAGLRQMVREQFGEEGADELMKTLQGRGNNRPQLQTSERQTQ